MAVAGSGGGVVTSSDDGINCGADCTEVYPAGTSITLTAMPARGSTFAGWSGDCSGSDATCTVVLGTTRLVTARFEGPPPPHNINGNYNLNQVLSYSCSLVSYNISSFLFLSNGAVLRVTGAPFFDPVMGGTGSLGGGDFSAQVLLGAVTYSLTGTFRPDLTAWDGVFRFTCAGAECDSTNPACTDQTYTVTGTRQ